MSSMCVDGEVWYIRHLTYICIIAVDTLAFTKPSNTSTTHRKSPYCCSP